MSEPRKRLCCLFVLSFFVFFFLPLAFNVVIDLVPIFFRFSLIVTLSEILDCFDVPYIIIVKQ